MDSVTWPERTFLPQYCYLASDIPPSSSIFLPQKTLPPPCCYLRELASLNSPSSMLLPRRTLFYPWVTLLQWTLTPPCCYQASEFLPPPCCYLVQTFLPPPPICCLRKLSPHHVVTSENSPSSMCYLAQWTLPPPCCYLASENSPSYMLPKRTLPLTFFLRELSLLPVVIPENSPSSMCYLASENSPSSMPSPTYQWTKARLAYIRSNLWFSLVARILIIKIKPCSLLYLDSFALRRLYQMDPSLYVELDKKQNKCSVLFEPGPCVSHGSRVGEHAHGSGCLGLGDMQLWQKCILQILGYGPKDEMQF